MNLGETQQDIFILASLVILGASGNVSNCLLSPSLSSASFDLGTRDRAVDQ